MKFPKITFVNEEAKSAGAISVRKPRLPRFIPKIGISLYPNTLDELNKVPSPYRYKSARLMTVLSSKPFIIFLILEDEGNGQMSIPRLFKTSVTCSAIREIFWLFVDE